jgi:hypothetical protein
MLVPTAFLLAQLAPPPPMAPPPQYQPYPSQPYPAQPYPQQPYPQQPYPPQQPAPAWNPFGPPPQPPQYAAPSATQQQLDAAEKEDSGRGLEVAWAMVDVGALGGALDAIGGQIPDAQHAGGFGGTAALSGGVRFITFTLGLRAEWMVTSGWSLGSVGLQAGYHLPMGRWDPFLELRGSYVGGSVSTTVSSDSGSVHGFDLGLAVGDDYYLSPSFSIGPELGANMLFVKDVTSATGVTAAARVRVGYHFDL